MCVNKQRQLKGKENCFVYWRSHGSNEVSISLRESNKDGSMTLGGCACVSSVNDAIQNGSSKRLIRRLC